MYRKLVCFVSFILVFGLCGSTAFGQENQIVNPEFDDGLSSWGIYTYLNTTEGFNVEAVQGAGLSGENSALLDIYNAPALSSIGIAQSGLVAERGKTYPIGFTAKAEQVRGLVVLLQGNINNASYPTFLDQTVELTQSRQDYIIEYTHTGNTIGAAEGESLNLYLMIKGPSWSPPGANLNSKVWLDRVHFGGLIPHQPVYYATGPTPENGAFIGDVWATLGWSPGDFAASHDLYLGENFEDVNEGTGGTFRVNQPETFYIVGIFGYPYPDGLVPGTTYYWRVDEVNDAVPGSPWKGPVWSFTVPSKKAYNPNPADGVKFVEPDVTLGWTAGFGAKMHYLYFGDNSADVEAGTGDTSKGLVMGTKFVPGTLEREKTYYWRIDATDGLVTHTGDVWSFTVARETGGLKAEFFNNASLAGEPALTRIDPQIDFSWGNGTTRGVNSPAENINVDQFSARWSGVLEIDVTDTYTFRISANNGFRLWLDGRRIIDYWENPTTSALESEPIELVGGTTCTIRMEYYEGADTAVARLYWENSVRPRQIIPQAALSPPVKASRPHPENGAEGAKMPAVFTWYPGDFAASHEIYFGTDKDAVINATSASPEYKGTRVLGDESYDPGELAWDTMYYWRIDEVNALNPDSPWVGSLWSFSTGDFIVIDDFEDYDINENQIWYSWHDGLGYGTQDNPPYFAGNGTGSAVGDETAWFPLEDIIIHGGLYSLPYSYDNNKQGFAKYSEIEKALSYPRDWTEEEVAELSLWFYGDPANAPELMYVAVSNTGGQSAVVIHDNPNAAQIDTWTEWVIPLQTFADRGVDLTDVDKIMIGFGTRGNTTAPGGSGSVLFDDVRLYQLRNASGE
ncbi:MAG: carbohydrate binding domain-containing protein [Sedimentisphaerales bacterium]|nr:carbohydrate binding domain-containing protein [Sedimentisphaerales bacterium]